LVIVLKVLGFLVLPSRHCINLLWLPGILLVISVSNLLSTLKSFLSVQFSFLCPLFSVNIFVFLTIFLIRNSTQSSILQLDGHFFFSGLPLQLLFLLHHLPMECLHLSEFTRLFLACQLVKNLNFREILFYKVENLFALIYLVCCHWWIFAHIFTRFVIDNTLELGHE